MLSLLLAIWLGKLISTLTKIFKIGGGSASPGLYALKIDPNLVNKLACQIPQNVVITGTNGKTTTARLLNHFLDHQKVKVVRNATGSNLERGVASALITQSDWSGKIQAVDLGIWELDEAAFNRTVFSLRPNLVVFLNAYRDQLDRYGEVDTIVNRWRQALAKIDWNPTVLVNGGDSHTFSLMDEAKAEVYEFRVKDHTLWTEGAGYQSKRSHQDDFLVRDVKNLGLKGTEFTLEDGKTSKVNFPLPGIYHIYDFLAAYGAYFLLNMPVDNLQEMIEGYIPAFGRMEKISIKGQEAFIFLIKNPAGATQVFETLAPELKADDQLLIALNDNFADGTDVSWIWDAQFESITGQVSSIKVICSGSRAKDLAVRLKYAGVDSSNLVVEEDLDKALKLAQKAEGRIFILPTYTALLELQKLLTKLKVKKEYWKE